MTKRPLVIAHRGASGYRPEHSRAAYELAIELGADALEPDIVSTRDGVLVLRHDNEISGTTDIATNPKFADRKTTKVVDGVELTGWFIEDFTWDELAKVRTMERLPKLRRGSTTFIGGGGILRLTDLLELIDAADRPIMLVAEIKHPTYFASIGLHLDEMFAAVMADWATPTNLVVESFEQSVLGKIRARGIPGHYVFLADDEGSPADLVAAMGAKAPSYAEHLTNEGLARLALSVDGVSVAKSLILKTDDEGHVIGTTDLVARAHALGLTAWTFTLRAENHFLAPNLRKGKADNMYGDWRREFRLIMDTGIDGVFADQPDLALQARDTEPTVVGPA
ncbi:glycerophosphodiester phosphodiesterase family protein [Glaciihabitans sp. dw_435]|uniref:glycerophosphodiester phosphodiesterase family protein n=1 Tax=Glaciihabitans sp. dw_435 TaxID=2720081 RepID=UPI001BD3640D|nr:glycerophosphodiester phosphodiesterase family protein [Glaciihabitans sp. dw_435]